MTALGGFIEAFAKAFLEAFEILGDAPTTGASPR
jgi:hypothetical protein